MPVVLSPAGCLVAFRQLPNIDGGLREYNPQLWVTNEHRDEVQTTSAHTLTEKWSPLENMLVDMRFKAGDTI
jgi:hypothetical protein